MRSFLFIAGVLWGLFLMWLIVVFSLKSLFDFSDKTVTYLINIGGVIFCIIGFAMGIKYGGSL